MILNFVKRSYPFHPSSRRSGAWLAMNDSDRIEFKCGKTRSSQKRRRQMKKLVFVSLIFLFASSASATVYKWIDEHGVVNFSDDSGKVPEDFRDKVQEVSVPKRDPALPLKTPVQTAVTRVPPIGQTLIR